MADLGKVFKGVGIALGGTSEVLRQAEQDKQRREQLAQQRANAEEARAGAEIQRKMAVTNGLASFYQSAANLSDPSLLDNLFQTYTPILEEASKEYGTAYTSDVRKQMKDYLSKSGENLQDAFNIVNTGVKAGKKPSEIWAEVAPRLNGMPPAMQNNVKDVFKLGLSELEKRQTAQKQARADQTVSRLSKGQLQSTQELEIANKLSTVSEKNAKAAKARVAESAQAKPLSTQEKKRLTEVLKEFDANNERLVNIDTAFDLVNKVSDKLVGLGPISGSKTIGTFRRVFGDSDFETIKALLGQEGLTKIAAFAKDAGARAIDSDGERAYLQQTLAGENMNPEAIKTLLYITKAQGLRKAQVIEAREEYLRQGGEGKLESPNADKQTYYKEGTNEVVLAVPGEEPEGFVALETRFSHQIPKAPRTSAQAERPSTDDIFSGIK